MLQAGRMMVELQRCGRGVDGIWNLCCGRPISGEDGSATDYLDKPQSALRFSHRAIPDLFG